MYLEKFELFEEYRKIKPFEIVFKDGLNLIVGENGSGKSTLLNIIYNSQNEKSEAKIKLTLSDYTLKNSVDTKFFDTEKNNPRIIKDFNESKDIGFDISSRFKSHGEVMFPILDYSKKMKNVVLFVDEPESGVSLSNQLKLLKSFNVAVENKCQLLIATHSYILIKNVEEVFDMTKLKWVKSKDYLKKF